MTKRNIAALAAVLLAAGIAGCGGDDGGGGGGSPGLTNYNTGPVPSVPAAGAVVTRTLLPATADTHEVETDGNWIVWKARQINLGYYNGSTYANLDLGLGGAVTPWAFSDDEQSPIAFDGTRIAFVANDVSDAAGPAFYYGAPGSAMRKLALPAAVTTTYLPDFKVAIYGNMAGFMDDSTDAVYVADLAAASPALVEVPYTGTVVGPPGNGLLPIIEGGMLKLLDLSDETGATVTTLTGDNVVDTSPIQLRFEYGAFTWVDGTNAYFYAPGYGPTDSTLIAVATVPGTQQSNPVSGPWGTYVIWQQGTSILQRSWAQLGQPLTPDDPGTTTVNEANFRTHPAMLNNAIASLGGLPAVKTGMPFLAWLADPAPTDGVDEAQLYTYYVGQPPPSPAVVKVTSDEGSGWGNSDSVFLAVDGSKVFFKQEFTNLHSPGRVFKVFDYASQSMTTILDERDFQQLPMALVASGKAVVLTRDHSFRLFAKTAGAAGAPVVVTPKSQDVKDFQIADGQLVYAALDRELYLDSEYLTQKVNNEGAEFLFEIYGHDLAAGGAPERLTYNATEDHAPQTDGEWATWFSYLYTASYSDEGFGFAMKLPTREAMVIGETNDKVNVSGGLAAYREYGTGYVRWVDLATGEAGGVDAAADFCPAVGGRVIAWTEGFTAHYFDLAAAAPEDVTIAGARPSYMSWGSEYSAPVDTDGRFIAWVEYRASWDPDDAGTEYPAPIAANVVAVHDLTTDTTALVPAADWDYTGIGLPELDSEGPVCNPKLSNGVVTFAALEYGAQNAATDYSEQWWNGSSYGGDLADKEIFIYDAALAPAAVTRVTNDADGLGLWDSRLRVGGNLAVWRAGGQSSWGWDGKVPAVAKLK